MIAVSVAMRRAAALQHYVAHCVFAFAAAHADAEFKLQFVEGDSAFGNRRANFLVRH